MIPLMLMAAAVCAQEALPDGRKALEKKSMEGRVEIQKKDIAFDDGDTLKHLGTEIRILGFDTPETIHEEHGIFIDQPYGPEASRRTKALIEGAHKVYLTVSGDKDKYGRTLAHVWVDDKLLGEHLLSEGLAYETVSRYGDAGKPEIALRLLMATLKAYKEDRAPKFQEPYLWRKENQRPVGDKPKSP